MTHDQADELRNIVSHSAGQRLAIAGDVPRLAVVAGGKGGVGTTTLAVNLSVALAQMGQRVVLVDADLDRPDVSSLCRLSERHSITDLLSSRRSIHELLEPGPGGMQVVPGTWAPIQTHPFSEAAQTRLIQQLKLLGPHADSVVLDAGSSVTEFTGRIWQSAEDVLLVTTPDTVSVMDTYASIKMMTQRGDINRIHVVVNQTSDERVAGDVYRRLERSCQRFLAVPLLAGGMVPLDKHVPEASQAGVPLIMRSPGCPAARSIDHLASTWIAAATGQAHSVEHKAA